MTLFSVVSNRGPFRSSYPLWGESYGQPLSGLLQAIWAQRAAEIWQRSSQTALGAIAVNVGMPVIEMFEETLDILSIDVVEEMKTGLRDAYGSINDAHQQMVQTDGGAAIKLTAAMGAGPAVNIAAAVPIVGAIAKMFWEIGKFLYKVRKINNASEAAIVYPDIVFNPAWDNQILNYLLEEIRANRNWDGLFSPPSMGQGVGTLQDFTITNTVTSDLIRRRELQAYSDAGWIGMVPGTGTLHQGLEIKNVHHMNDIGSTYLPSARSLLTWVWQNTIGHGNVFTPSMFCVNTEGDPQWWKQYIFDLHKFIYETDQLSDAVKKKTIVNWNKDQSTGKKIFGWGTSVEPDQNEWENYLPVKELNKLRERQMGFLDTLMVAYVDDSYTAIKNNTEMRTRWSQRRQQLLEHPARCDVELSSVPDADYKQELKNRGVGQGQCMVGGFGLAATNTDNPFWPPGNLPDGQTPGSEPQRVSGKKKAGDRKIPLWVPIAGAAAVSAGAYYGYKKGLHEELFSQVKGFRQKLSR